MKKVILIIVIMLVGYNGYCSNKSIGKIPTKLKVSMKIPYRVYKYNPNLIPNAKFKSKLIYTIPAKKRTFLT